MELLVGVLAAPESEECIDTVAPSGSESTPSKTKARYNASPVAQSTPHSMMVFAARP